MADYPNPGKEMDVNDHPDNSHQYFTIPSRDFSKEPASLGEMAVTTGKMLAEPYARIGRDLYNKITK